MLTTLEHTQRESFFLVCQELKKHISYTFEKIDLIESCLKKISQNFYQTLI